jgi:trehalose/maltose hydrolase-like predicted phosphorylase
LAVVALTGASASVAFETQSVLGQRFSASLEPGGVVACDVVVSTCRGPAPLSEARAGVARGRQAGFDALKRSQAEAMRAIWRGFDVSADDPFLERRLRGAMFYLTAGYRDDVVWGGTPSSLSSKMNWGNCVFWDTEFYMFPPLLLAQPAIARNMLLYRHGLLNGARANARTGGACGARFGWQSHRDGSGHAGAFEDEIHITADIAYCAWWYAQSTGDVDFFDRFGREIIVEAARFFASRTLWNAGMSRAEIRGVLPPDEHVWDHYAGRVATSAMTNGYAAWTMAKGAEAGEGLATPEERAEWARLAKALWLPRDPERGVFAEYEGYRGHAVKQADVGHLFFPLLVSADRDEIRRNVYYYADRERETGLYLLHSPSVYGAALSRAGDAAGVRRFLELSARNATGPFEVPRESNYGGGVCTTASGSFLTLALYGLLGIENQGGTLTAHPCLTEETGALSIAGLEFRGRRYSVSAEPRAAGAIIQAL